MRIHRRGTCLLLSAMFLVAACALPAHAAKSLSIRLVHATQQPKASTRGLEDVAGVLTRSLPYNHFALEASGSLGLPAAGTASLGGYSVRCDGPQNRVTIQVRQGKKVLINTTVSLRDKTPLVLGGLSASKGKLLLVFVAR